MGSGPTLVIMDVDPGVDDGWAMLAMLRAQRQGLVRLLAVVCASGNSTMENSIINTCRILQTANARDIPVYRGKANKEIDANVASDNFFGLDGFGDIPFSEQPDLSQVKPDDGLEVIDRLANQYPGQVTLMCLAPLSNIAEAIQAHPDMTTRLKEILIMGGNYGAEEAEYNFLKDPLSANTVLEDARCPITLFPWEPCLNLGITLDWYFDSLKNASSPAAQLLYRVEKKCWQTKPCGELWVECDLYTALSISNSNVVTESIITHAKCEVGRGNPKIGQLTIDHSKERKNIKIITKLNAVLIQKELLELSNDS